MEVFYSNLEKTYGGKGKRRLTNQCRSMLTAVKKVAGKFADHPDMGRDIDIGEFL